MRNQVQQQIRVAECLPLWLAVAAWHRAQLNAVKLLVASCCFLKSPCMHRLRAPIMAHHDPLSAGYPGGGSWGRDHMYGGTDQAARDYGGGAAGGGGIMPANGSAGAGMMAGGMAGGMSSGMGGSMAGGGGMMGQGGGIGMMSGLGMAGAGMMQQGGRGGGMAGGGPMMGGSGAMVAMNNSMGGMGSMGGAGMGNMGSMGGAGMGGGMMGGGGGMMPQHGGGGGSMMGHDGGAFPAVKLRGLPFGVHEEEVRAFLVRTPLADPWNVEQCLSGSGFLCVTSTGRVRF